MEEHKLETQSEQFSDLASSCHKKIKRAGEVAGTRVPLILLASMLCCGEGQ